MGPFENSVRRQRDGLKLMRRSLLAAVEHLDQAINALDGMWPGPADPPACDRCGHDREHHTALMMGGTLVSETDQSCTKCICGEFMAATTEGT